MSTVEDRLRDALAERAAQCPIDPGAWEKTAARARRPDRAGGWHRFGLPAAAAAAVAAIVVGATALTGGLGGPRGGPGGATPTASPSGMPAPPGPNDYLMRQVPPVTAVVSIKLTWNGQTSWTFVWFGYAKNDRREGIELCSVTDGSYYAGTGGCGSAPIPAGKVAVVGGGVSGISMGTSITRVTSVAAHLQTGRTVPGVVAYGRGFPDKVWAVAYPAFDNASIVFRDASGRQLGQLSIAGQYPAPSRPRSGGITVFRYPTGVEGGGPGRMTAYLLDGRVLGVNGKIVGFWDSVNSSAIANVPASGPPAVVVFNTGGVPKPTAVVFYGYAHENVTRVVLRLGNGQQYGAYTFPAWPGSGLRLWAFSMPGNLAFAGSRPTVMLAYNAADQVVWQQTY